MTVLECTPAGQLGAAGSGGRDPGIWALTLSDPGWPEWRPGQFAMVRPVAWGLELTWARPFSIAWAGPEGLRLLFQVVGRGTARLAGLRPGDAVTIWGPLGNGFAVEAGTETLLLAGGMGIAPFPGYARRHPTPEKLSALFAHRLPLELYPQAELAGLCPCETRLESGPQDLPGIIQALQDRVAAMPRDGLVLACGPTPFMRTVRTAALAAGVRCQVSLENRMACGVGACLGCVVQRPSGLPSQTCTAGPVFWADEIEL
ncbi:MAG: dihydroorotate dehydrogenase electron transfer subunit [Desulfovibrionaceae bacterium]